MKKITDRIDAHGFTDFKIIEIRSNETQLYLLRDRVESKRNIESHSYDITVYADHASADGTLRGEYNFEYKPNTDLQFYLEQAKFACSMIKNRYYGLIQKTKPSNVQILDPKLENLDEVGTQLTESIYQSTRDASVYLSGAEIYLKKSEITLKTSTGIELSKIKGLISVEITLIAKRGKEEQELNFHLRRRSIEDLRLQQRIEEYKEHTLKTLDVQVPRSGKANVVFNASDVYSLLHPLIFHSSGKAMDQGISRFRVNERIVEQAANDFTLKTSGILPFGLYTDPFDDDGISGQEHTIIDRGIFKKYWATKRYADYLNVEPTGSFKNLIIEPVSNEISSTDSYYDIVQFSDLSPDPITGDLVAEIRFGYQVQNGKKIPIKGGSIGCNVFEALKNIQFSDNHTFEGLYSGPTFIVLRDLSISGQ